MNILVLCDQFVRGGLETHIATFADALGDSHSTWVACSHYVPTGLLDDKTVFSGFHFSFYDTADHLREDTERLCAIIEEKQIDVLHVHPWFGLYPAVFAAAKTGAKLVMTAHGLVSLNYNGNFYDQIWMEDILTNAASHVFGVSEGVLEMLESIHMRRASWLPNAVDLSRFQPAEPCSYRTWAMVSRLDDDKLADVEALIRMLPQLEIDAVDIYGDGAQRKAVETLAAACPKPVRLMGHSDALFQVLREGYAGVIGLGRCAIEGLALNLPVLFAGYGKLCGMIDRDLYPAAARRNFVTDRFPAMQPDALNAQLRRVYSDPGAYRLAETVRADYDARICAERMARTIADAPSGVPQYYGRLYEKLLELPGDTPLHASESVFRLVRETLSGQTWNLNVKDQLLQHQLTEQKREETAYQLRLAWNDMDRRHIATQQALDSETLRREDDSRRMQEQLDALADRAAALADANTALREQTQALREQTQALQEQTQALQNARSELTARLDTLTLGYLLRQWFRWKVLRPLKRLFGKGE